MTKRSEAFDRLLQQATAHAQSEDGHDRSYWQGFQRGVRRAYLGDSYMDDSEHARALSLSSRMGEGYRAGFDALRRTSSGRTRRPISVTIPSRLLDILESERGADESRSRQVVRLLTKALDLPPEVELAIQEGQ